MTQFIIIAILLVISCYKQDDDNMPVPPITQLSNQIDFWLTSGDQTNLLKKQNLNLAFTTAVNNYTSIDIDSTQSYQSIDGFGYTLTGGSATLINRMNTYQKENLLNELFACTGESLCISYLRISLGASDLDSSVFSYNDIKAGTEDLTLSQFSLSRDTLHLIPVLKGILKINPNMKIMASPWSAPTWMKSNKNSVGGSLLPQYYQVYAAYFVKYIQEMKKQGISIDAITVQNEPQHGGNNPSMLMSAAEQNDFIKNHLGPAFRNAQISTKIIIWDHNCDNPEYPISILNDAVTKSFVDGTAFHLYAGQISALTKVKEAHPDKNLYFTEQWTSANGSFSTDLLWHIRNVIIGSTRNWSKVALEWNLANDPGFGPHTPGGCTLCKGALTISGDIVTRNVSYYIIAHASRFIPAGAVRIFSTAPTNLPNVAFLRPDGKKVLIAMNDSANAETFNIAFNGKKAVVYLPAKAVGTFVW